RTLAAEHKDRANLRQEIDALRSRQQALEDLQADRNQQVYLLDELVRQTPEGVFLRTVKQEERKVTLTGYAASNERVSEFLRNLSSNGTYVEKPELIEIKVAGQSPTGVSRRVFEFSLSFTLKLTPERTELQQAASQGPRRAPASAAAKN
ncbi:MAG: PilN domain-containing protein, partial [Burkholderiaceae bacterium]